MIENIKNLYWSGQSEFWAVRKIFEDGDLMIACQHGMMKEWSFEITQMSFYQGSTVLLGMCISEHITKSLLALVL